MFFDGHLHAIGKESGGFIIGLEGTPFFEGTMNNKEVLALHNPENNYIAFYYVANDELNTCINHPYLKYHPRREHYSCDGIIKSIQINNPKCVIIDTLNEPYLTAYDYWVVAKAFPDIPFIFAHAGGYLINEFVKICNFQPNVWIDFALTAVQLGKLGDKNGLQYVHQAITYALNSSFSNRILFASDYPFFRQEDYLMYYSKLDKLELLNMNYLSLLKMII